MIFSLGSLGICTHFPLSWPIWHLTWCPVNVSLNSWGTAWELSTESSILTGRSGRMWRAERRERKGRFFRQKNWKNKKVIDNKGQLLAPKGLKLGRWTHRCSNLGSFTDEGPWADLVISSSLISSCALWFHNTCLDKPWIFIARRWDHRQEITQQALKGQQVEVITALCFWVYVPSLSTSSLGLWACPPCLVP